MVTSSVGNSQVRLLAPKIRGTVSLEETLSKRESVRTYNQDPLSMEEVSQLLWSAQGITHEDGRRTAPSAGATDPLVIYVVVNRVDVLEPGIYHYQYNDHCLELRKAGRFGKELRTASLGQDMVEHAAMDIVVSAVYERTTTRYGERGIRYVHMEVGHVGQNISLQADALGLGTVVVGAFHDGKVKTLLGIEEDPLYIMPVGRM